MYKRIFLIVMDSLGCGEAPDAKDYNDLGSNTIGHIAERMNLRIPNMQKLGYGNIVPIKGVPAVSNPLASYTKIQEASKGKDTMTGHWEMMGLYITEPFQTFTDTGFPKELLDELSRQTGRGIIGNKSASGTEILVELGEQHMKTGDLIVYTSADSVLQIAMHEDIIPIEEQYRICEIAREITMKEEWKVARVIARPFVGKDKNSFKRTPNRHDYALKPTGKTTLNYLDEAGFDVIALGKINDIFVGEGINNYERTVSNDDGMDKITKIAKNHPFKGLCFLNLVDFDALYGHRRDPIGYGKAIEDFDRQLPDLIANLNENDLLMITADHGNDPIHHGTDHTREYVPLLAYQKGKPGKALPAMFTFADIAATISENFKVDKTEYGKSFLKNLKEA
ncbi:phosphopentomutase [Acholeplasma morum]|uniref:phosphopentomutase n=1 Tax=Paracholeplasma morum TaxID=264637 RepID=UPI001958D5FE|nr:phosphopentomutase [Paracholeplasma morum]MBM7453224.1 phosphopentomutase [Paracholeplasma morum]